MYVVVRTSIENLATRRLPLGRSSRSFLDVSRQLVIKRSTNQHGHRHHQHPHPRCSPWRDQPSHHHRPRERTKQDNLDEDARKNNDVNQAAIPDIRRRNSAVSPCCPCRPAHIVVLGESVGLDDGKNANIIIVVIVIVIASSDALPAIYSRRRRG